MLSKRILSMFQVLLSGGVAVTTDLNRLTELPCSSLVLESCGLRVPTGPSNILHPVRPDQHPFVGMPFDLESFRIR